MTKRILVRRPELTIDEANEMIGSPARRRRTSGDSDVSETGPAAAPLPVKKRIMEAIQEEQTAAAARVPATEVTTEDVKVSSGNENCKIFTTTP